MKQEKPSLTRSLLMGLFVVIAILVFAYGFSVTNVNFEKTRSERRLTQLTRIIRALAHPDIFEYEREEVFVEAPVYLPCPEGGPDVPEPDTSGPYLVLDPPCAGPGEFIVVEGYKFIPGTGGPLNFIPPPPPGETTSASLTMGSFKVDKDGHFQERVKLPRRQPVEEAQTVRAVARKNVGLPQFTGVAKATWAKIVETVFLALLATTFGTLLAIPVSFLAARNLMSDIKSPLTSVALMLLGWPIGIGISLWILGYILQVRDVLTASIALNVIGLVVTPMVTYGTARWAFQHEEEEAVTSTAKRIARLLAMFVAAFSSILAVALLASLMYTVGIYLTEVLGPLSFFGYFIAQLGDMFRMVTPVLVALAAGAVVGGLGNVSGAVIGGLLFGLMETFAMGFIPQGTAWKDLIAFSVVILFLILRPTGIMGQKEFEKV